MEDKPKRGRPRGSYGAYGTRPEPKELIHDRQTGARLHRPDTTPRPAAQDEADGWARAGVRGLAGTAPEDDHVVLMAATYEHSGRVGAASSVRCDAETAMGALGVLVAEVNRALARDDVRVRLELRLRPVDALAGQTERTSLWEAAVK